MIEYEIIKCKRKSLSIQITKDCNVIVRTPYFVTKNQVEKIIKEKEQWILDTLQKVEKEKAKKEFTYTDEDIKALLEYISQKAAYYSSIMGVSYSSIKITKAKTRFGSCNTKTGSLCFSYMLLNRPKEAVDCVVVHELSHLVHPNHSKEFYKFIEKYMPDYKERDKLLK